MMEPTISREPIHSLNYEFFTAELEMNKMDNLWEIQKKISYDV